MSYPYQLYDGKGKVICQICGKSYLVISPKHLKKHNITHGDYTKRFPNAPLSNEEFKARGKYGKNKDLFIHPENEIMGNDVLIDEAYIEELSDVEKFIKKELPYDPLRAMKNKLFDHLKLYFANVKVDYLIRQFETNGDLKFEFITDFCDPILKVVIQFPDTFWHNHDVYIDMNKTEKLEKYGWKVYKIESNNPSLQQIDDVLTDL